MATPLIGAVVGLVALVRGESFGDAAGWGFSAAGSGFLAWAIARELHPDRVWVATLATFLAPFGLLWSGADLLASATILLVARAVAGTTGRSLREGDIVLLLAVGVPVMMRDSGVAALGFGAVGLAVTAILHSHRRPVHVVGALLYAIGAVVAIVVVGELAVLDAGDDLLLGVGIAAGVVSLIGPAALVSQADRSGGGGLLPGRVRIARLIALATAVGVSIAAGPATMAPAWAALLATAVRPR